MKLVSPKNPIPFETVFLSNIDLAVTFPVETLFFFEVPPSKCSSTEDISERVKRAVAEVLLVLYYFLAGRLYFNHESKRLELLCNNAGVLFVRATSGLMLKDLGNHSLPNPIFRYFVHWPVYTKALLILHFSQFRQPLLIFSHFSHPEEKLISEFFFFCLMIWQVTRFRCGGFSIGIVTNHGVLDGRSAVEMLQNLASICRGEGLKPQCVCNDRRCMRARNPPQIKYPHQEYVKLAETSCIASSFTFLNQSSIGFLKQVHPQTLSFRSRNAGHTQGENHEQVLNL